MRRFAWTAAVLVALAGTAAAADDRDPLTRARVLYNERRWTAAVAAADQARANPARADSADLIAARAHLEQFRESNLAIDLGSARERIRRINPQRFLPRERLEFIVGLGETLFLEGSYGAAAEVFDSVLEPSGALAGPERERVIDWWATALDRDARPRTEFERQAIYQRIRDRMQGELGVTPASTAVVRDRKLALPLAPNRLPDEPLPNAAPMSAPLPCCRSTNAQIASATPTCTTSRNPSK